MLKAEDVKLERGGSPELVAAGMEGRSSAPCRLEGQAVRGGRERMWFWGRLAPPPEKRPIGKVLNPSCALIPRPGKRGGEGR